MYAFIWGKQAQMTTERMGHALVIKVIGKKMQKYWKI